MAENQGKVDLNTAAPRELAAMVGIGDESADRIVKYREQPGRLESVEELSDELKGFGEPAMRHLREQART